VAAITVATQATTENKLKVTAAVTRAAKRRNSMRLLPGSHRAAVAAATPRPPMTINSAYTGSSFGIWESRLPSGPLQQPLDAAAIDAVTLHNHSGQGMLDQRESEYSAIFSCINASPRPKIPFIPDEK
jgi:hypothetical protein